MKKDLVSIENMILIGSTGRNSGKTTLASALINKFKSDIKVIALKITTIEHKMESVKEVEKDVVYAPT